MEAKVLSEAKVYVGTYAKYNNGSLSGAWLDLSDHSKPPLSLFKSVIGETTPLNFDELIHFSDLLYH